MTIQEINKKIDGRLCPATVGLHSYVSYCKNGECGQCWKRAIEGGKTNDKTKN